MSKSLLSKDEIDSAFYISSLRYCSRASKILGDLVPILFGLAFCNYVSFFGCPLSTLAPSLQSFSMLIGLLFFLNSAIILL